jgi:hypothetical protein
MILNPMLLRNRGFVWIKTVTICPTHSNLHSMTHTFPIAMGLKKSSHEAVEKKCAEEIASLSQQSTTNEMYSKRDNCMVIVFVEILDSLMDYRRASLRRHAHRCSPSFASLPAF